MTDVPSKHVWKIKESRIVFKDFDITKTKNNNNKKKKPTHFKHKGTIQEIYLI